MTKELAEELAVYLKQCISDFCEDLDAEGRPKDAESIRNGVEWDISGGESIN
jgi:hypothetical protein